MANTNPKLEFFRFQLKSKKDKDVTFKDFAIEELKAKKTILNENVTQLIHKHFISSLKESFAKDDKIQKKVSLVEKASLNIHIDKKPVYQSDNFIIKGVINGGPYGRDGVIADNEDEDKNEKLSKSKTILLYYYFLLYVPADHNEGCFIIHSNSTEDTITNIFRHYIKNLFKGDQYYQPTLEAFCPKSFQDEFKKGALLRSMSFKDTFIDDIHTTSSVQEDFNTYDIKIEIIPRNKDILVTQAEAYRKKFITKLFGSTYNAKTLKEFKKNSLEIQNPVDKVSKIFEWNTKDNEFIPTVYLEERIKLNNGIPDFIELDKLCLNLLKDEIIPTLRQDLNATKIQ